MRLKKQIAILALGAGFAGCTPQPATNLIEDNMEFAQQQLRFAFDEIDYAIVNESPESRAKREKNGWGELTNPRNSEPDGTLNLVPSKDWTSGFFPGNLWLIYQITGKENLKDAAIHFTNFLYPVRKYKGTHDIGFMMNCSYGNAYRLAPADSVRQALIQTADNLCGRFDSKIGCIRSWDFGRWNFPVIIDNMMNLDLLFYVYRLTGNPQYKEIALQHARVTQQHQFREDYSSYHVVSYNDDRSVEEKCTHQGKNDDSAWARGQAWGVYGYTSCYRESKNTLFLQQAKNIAAMIMDRVKTEDLIPLWDYDAPDTPETPRDVSAASITASALIELSTLTENGQIYLNYAEKLLHSLSSDAYLAKAGTNQGFLLMHSVGSLPNGSEIDTPLNYADYYYLEALLRYMQVKRLDYESL